MCTVSSPLKPACFPKESAQCVVPCGPWEHSSFVFQPRWRSCRVNFHGKKPGRGAADDGCKPESDVFYCSVIHLVAYSHIRHTAPGQTLPGLHISNKKGAGFRACGTFFFLSTQNICRSYDTVIISPFWEQRGVVTLAFSSSTQLNLALL